LIIEIKSESEESLVVDGIIKYSLWDMHEPSLQKGAPYQGKTASG